ncbi:MAG: GMC family oxidoreductase [Alphaproteobacteria bacterium]|nr:GMC family oxidoreductase [Alphaproteobacteria bacterium]
MIHVLSADTGELTAEVCVIGAGPAGITTALELARLGCPVLLLESGGLKPSPQAQQLAEATIRSPQHHAPMAVAVQRSLGGASNLWGGRCVPLDALDFAARLAVPNSGWPIGMHDFAPFLPAACAYLNCGEPEFSDPIPALDIADRRFGVDRLERWSTRPRLKEAHGKTLRDSTRIELVLDATVVNFAFAEDGRVRHVTVKAPGSPPVAVHARAFVVAAGGLENARLLLVARRNAPQRFGGSEGPLGRYYMGHLYGSVAQAVFADQRLDAGLDYFFDGRGSYVRRRFTPSAEMQQAHGLQNIALWPEFPPLYDPGHRNSVLSLGYLALSLPPVGRMLVAESIRRSHIGAYVGAELRRGPHVLNLIRGMPQAAAFFPRFMYRRHFGRPPLPGFFQRSPHRRYAIRYHAEHAPDPESRVQLSADRDALGVPRLDIDLRVAERDVDSVLRAHQCFAAWLADTGLGRMVWSYPAAERRAALLRQSYDGHHQIGTTRMAATPRHGVVDADCRVFGAANLFVAGSSVFPTSGQANPTLNAATLAVRLARRIASELSRTERPQPELALQRVRIPESVA